MSGAALLKEADVGGSFHYGGVNSVILCRRFQRRGGLLKSIQLGGSHMCNVFQPSSRNISTLMLFIYGLKCIYDST